MTEKTEALRLADALKAATEQTDAEDDVIHVARWFVEDADAELRRLHAENETLKQSVARLQQHHATAWNRGHMLGMKANEDTARRALDAVKQDAWGNTQLTEALLKAEAQRDALLEAMQSIADCCDEEHAARDYAPRQTEIRGIARAAIKAAEGENHAKNL